MNEWYEMNDKAQKELFAHLEVPIFNEVAIQIPGCKDTNNYPTSDNALDSIRNHTKPLIEHHERASQTNYLQPTGPEAV